MNYGPVTRPSASELKVTTKDSFELCYLRHQYFRRAAYNPTEAEMQPFMKIVEHFTKNTFFTYFNLFRAVGMYHDDILNVGRVHLVSFLGLYALDRMEDKKKKWTVHFLIDNDKEPDEKDAEQKNKANFTMFFKQRMEDLVRVCRQKVRNIKGQPSEEYISFCGSEKPPKYPKRLLKEFDILGYKKIDFAIFKSIRKKADVNHDATIFQFDNLWYVALALEQKQLDLDDIVGAGSDPYENKHNMQPDELYKEKEFEEFQALFSRKSNERKVTIIRKFIAKNRKNVHYKEEINVARKLLRELGA
jgi:hypothetical protein